jgi:hypothetical protein
MHRTVHHHVYHQVHARGGGTRGARGTGSAEGSRGAADDATVGASNGVGYGPAQLFAAEGLVTRLSSCDLSRALSSCIYSV